MILVQPGSVIQTGKRKKFDRDFRKGRSWAKLAVSRSEDLVDLREQREGSHKFHGVRFFSVLGTTFNASFALLEASVALLTASCSAARSAWFFGLNFSRSGIVSRVNFARSSTESRTSSLRL